MIIIFCVDTKSSVVIKNSNIKVSISSDGMVDISGFDYTMKINDNKTYLDLLNCLSCDKTVITVKEKKGSYVYNKMYDIIKVSGGLYGILEQ